VRRELEAAGIVRCPSNEELAEEAPIAYKDVERVVDVVVRAGIAKRVARLRPLGVLRG
jgi:tRNA-splicing ligase RtcB (3'-phosphate/5'-hydroxy nucleic acid ligase)